MTEEDKEVQEFIDMFPYIPSPEQYPKCFALYVKLYKYYKSKKTTSDLKTFQLFCLSAIWGLSGFLKDAQEYL